MSVYNKIPPHKSYIPFTVRYSIPVRSAYSMLERMVAGGIKEEKDVGLGLNQSFFKA
jgi:hypothetical protein